MVHGHPTGLHGSVPAPGTRAGLQLQVWGGGTDGKRLLMSTIPVPNPIIIKEEFMKRCGEVPPLLSLQLAGDPQTCAPQLCPVGASAGRAGARGGETMSQSLGGAVVTLCEGQAFWICNFPGSSRRRFGIRRQSQGSGAGPCPTEPPRAPGTPQFPGHLGPSHNAKGNMSLGRLPEMALLGHGGIKGGNRLSAAARLRRGAGDRRGDSVMGHWGWGG